MGWGSGDSAGATRGKGVLVRQLFVLRGGAGAVSGVVVVVVVVLP
jgi:hypothetical protein